VADQEGGWQSFLMILLVTSVVAAVSMTSFLYADFRGSILENKVAY
jgi:hypothetical protein